MSTPIGRIDSGGGPPEDGKMEARVSALEQTTVEVRERLARIEATMATLATKEDVHGLINGLIRWMVGLAIGISVAAITIITFVLNYAAPPRAPAPQLVLPPPTVIVVPPAAPK